ncbi:MAG: hypothetical protein ISP49_17425, partial [Reyranella sp.]|nr:hypothetical protein [Reyranella sp.]
MPQLAAAQATDAAPAAASEDPDAWRFQSALYGWAIGVSGNMTARGQ